MAAELQALALALSDRYEIVRELGQGGMATVYLAKDLKHDRLVALKVLRSELAASLGADRFLREVHIAASLAHPHILGLHDSGEAEDFLYYVMPFVEGESLGDRLSRQRELPVHDAVRILRDVVDALAYAHGRNVVHRDIKPDNVMLSGRHAMVTDFGVAKAVSEATGRQTLTTAGVALGTPSYMAPEQATADPHIDHRADVYAVGAMAYEMLTGTPPFAAPTAQQVLAAHVAETPEPPRARRAAIPASLEQFVLKCLEKRPADRYQTADDMLSVLDAALTPSGGMTPTDTRPVTGMSAPARVPRAAVLTGVIVAVAVLGFLGWSSLRGSGGTVTLSEIRQVTRGPDPELEPEVSPDGGEVAYSSGYGGAVEILVSDLSGGRPIALTADRSGTQAGARWMPDGRAIAFVETADRSSVVSFTRAIRNVVFTTYVLPRFGGAATLLLENAAVTSIRGEWVAFIRSDSLFAHHLPSGETEPVETGDAREIHSASWSPDRERLAFAAGNPEFIDPFNPGNLAPSAIWIADRERGEAVPVIDDGRMNLSPVWLPDGRRLLFVSNRDGPRDLYLLRLGRDNRPAGEPTRVTTGLEPQNVSLSADGRTAVYSRFIFRSNLWSIAIPETGALSIRAAEPVVQGNEILENHGLSPDGAWLAFDSDREGNQDLYVMPLAGGEARRVTSDPGDDFHPDFSPDGREIAFYSMRHGTRDLFLVRPDGTGEQRLTDGPEQELHPSFSPDGRHIAYVTIGAAGGAINLMSRDAPGAGWGTPRVLASSMTGPPRWSPDGRRVVFAVEVARLATVTPAGDVRSLVDGRVHGLVETLGPEWSADGRTVYFVGVDTASSSAVYAVAANGGTPRPVVRFDDPRFSFGQWMSVAGDRLLLTLTEYEADVYTAKLDF